MQPISRKIDLATGLSSHILEWDADSDHTVILVHGFLDLAWGWQPMVESGLAGRFHLVAVDMRGHGDSDRIGPGGYYHFMDYLADLADVVAQLGREKVSLVGHSMGGSICSYYAGTFPEQVNKLAMLEGLGPPEVSMTMPQRTRSWIEGWKRARSHESRSYPGVAEAAARLRAHDDLLQPEMAKMLAERGTVEAADGGRRFKHDPLHLTRGPYPFQVDLAASFWRDITCPVLFLEGSESTFTHHRDEVEKRTGFFQKAERKTIDGAAHMMHRHRPAELARILAEFLAGQ